MARFFYLKIKIYRQMLTSGVNFLIQFKYIISEFQFTLQLGEFFLFIKKSLYLLKGVF